MEILLPLRPDQELRARRFADFLANVETINDLLGEGGDFAGDHEPREPSPPAVPPAAAYAEYFAPVIALHPQPAIYHAGRAVLQLVRQ